MSRRQGENPQDSLELLLDTISNVFGAIILIAILVVLQVSTTTIRMPQSDPDARGRALEGKKLKFEAQRLSAQLAELRDDQTLIPRPPGSKVSTTIEERKAAFLKAIAKANQRLKEANSKIPSGKKAMRDVAVLLEKAEKQVLKKQKELQAVKRTGTIAASGKKVRLPYRHKRNRRLAQRQYLVKGTRVWPLPQATTRRPAPIKGGTLYKEVLGKGIDVPRGSKGRGLGAILATMDGKSSRSHFISFWVARSSDSFETFQELRALFVEQGYEYSVGSYPIKPGLILYRGNPEVE